MSASLEEQRRALLEQIEASRAVYRRMLAGEKMTARSDLTGSARHRPAVAGAGVADSAGRVDILPPSTADRASPRGRSKAAQWATDHPLWVAAGVAMLVLLLPRAAEARRHSAGRRQRGKQLRRNEALAQSMPQARGADAARALVAAALLVLRDPARLKTASRLAAAGWRWLQGWRMH